MGNKQKNLIFIAIIIHPHVLAVSPACVRLLWIATPAGGGRQRCSKLRSRNQNLNHRQHLQDTFRFIFVFLPNSLSFDENVLVFRIQHTLTDELLGHRNGHIVGDTEV